MTERGEVRFGDASIKFRVVRSPKRHKTIEITVDEPGVVTVTAPSDTPPERLEATVRRRARWIVQHNGAATAAPPIRRFVSGESLPYLGRSVRLTVHPTSDPKVEIRFHHWQFDVDVPRELEGEARRTKVMAAFEAWYRERAQLKLPPRVDRVASLLGVRPKAVLVRDQRVRWASCAPDGTLRFNWRAIMAPPAILDYVIAHELAHLRVRAHSPEYWAIVAQAMPDYRVRRERLREVGAALDI
jgi:predicted metal-dependent hydrolase